MRRGANTLITLCVMAILIAALPAWVVAAHQVSSQMSSESSAVIGDGNGSGDSETLGGPGGGQSFDESGDDDDPGETILGGSPSAGVSASPLWELGFALKIWLQGQAALRI